MHPYLLPTLNFGPLVIGRLVKALAAEQYDVPLEEGRFTPREVVAHLADWEPILQARVRQAVESPGSDCVIYDEGEMAVEHNYAGTDIFVELNKWQMERQKTAEYASSLAQEDLNKTVMHPERGELSTEDLVGMLLGHDMYHVEQLTAHLAERVVPTF